MDERARWTTPALIALLTALVALAGCRPQEPDANAPSGAADGAVPETPTVTGLQMPESAICLPESRQVFISSVEGKPEGAWVKNGKGHITLIDYEGNVLEDRWLESTPEAPLNGPKGLNVLDGYLYIADIDRLLRVPLEGERTVEVVPVEGLVRCNDVATDGTSIWCSDTEAGRIYAYNPADESVREIKAPAGINGLTFDGETMYGVSWPQHEVFELDPTGENDPVSFGLADNFESLDSVEVLEDGTFIVSDFLGGTVYTIGADRRTVKPLLKLKSPADVGIDQEAGLMFVPQMRADQLTIFHMSQMD